MQTLSIVGHIGNDAEVKDLGNTQVINFSLACTEKIKEENKTTWYKCAYFTNNVGIAPYLLKGSLVGIIGKPDLETYVANDGTTKANLKCIVREIKLYSSTKEKNTTQQTQQSIAPKPATPSQAFELANNSAEEEHDDLPF